MRRSTIVLSGVIIVVLGVALAGLLSYTSQPSFCSRCHAIAPFADSWHGSSHEKAGVTCIQCHFEPGAVGYVKGKIYSVLKLGRWAVGQTEGRPEALNTITGGSCRRCHPSPTSTFLPHAFHTEVGNLDCVECHSAVVHRPEQVGLDKPQAKPDPGFCNKCHTGDIAPILFAPIPPVGREHPGVPKIDVNVWRNIHWRMADRPAVIDGVPYDKIQRDTCLVCHQEPAQARACKGCHFARVPEFRISTSAGRASGFPVGLGALVVLLMLMAAFLSGRRKVAFFRSRWMLALVVLVVVSDFYLVYVLLRDTLTRETGSVEIGPTTVWITYLLLSGTLVMLVLYEVVIRPGHDRPILFPVTLEEEIYVADHRTWQQREQPVEEPPHPPDASGSDVERNDG